MSKAPVKVPNCSVKTASPAVEVDVLPVFQDASGKAVVAKNAYAKTLERLRKSAAFTAKFPSTQFLRLAGKGKAESLCLVAMGVEKELASDRIRSAGGHAWARLVAEKADSVAVHLDALVGASGEASALSRATAFAEGLLYGAYQFNEHKSKPVDAAWPKTITFVTKNAKLAKDFAPELKLVLEALRAMNVTRDWSNQPSNTGTPEYYAAEAKIFAKEYGLKCTILGEAEAKREKMGLFLAVGQGSEREGKIVILEHAPAKAKKTLVLVGKGVTFDSGGISIKPSMRMEEMKHDMTGAATCMGAILLAAKLKVPTRVVAILGFTENMPSGTAIQPGNVVAARNGKTVEIINTDAEGRLILADLLDYAHEFKPSAIVNVATLTGAVGVALGKQCCGLMGNDESFMSQVKAAAKSKDEKVWELPCWDEYFEDMRSDTADMRNSCNDSMGGTIRGGVFLKQFIRKGTPWVHMDIAYTGNGVTHIPYFPKKGGTGAHVRTLAALALEMGSDDA